MLRKLLYIFLFSFILTFGCSNDVIKTTAPPDNISLEEVTNINLKTLDLYKLSKSDIHEIDGIKLNQDALGYELEYRYPNKPIKIKIVKFVNKDNLQSFWENWLVLHHLDELNKKKETVKFALNGIDMDYAIYAWQKGQWFTYIGVPVETPQSEPLRDKVKEIISNHYSNLAKKEINGIK